MKRIILPICLITLLSIPFAAHPFWQSKKDNKPVAELELMTNWELAMEAHDVCFMGASNRFLGEFKNLPRDLNTKETINRAREHLSRAQDAGDYIELIGRVYRKRLGHDLDFIMNLRMAALKGITEDCTSAVDEFRLKARKPVKDW